MKMCREEKTQLLLRMVLFIQIFPNVKHFNFWACGSQLILGHIPF